MSETDETPVNPAFLKGFNNGYLLQKHEPVLIAEVLKDIKPKEHPYIQGLESGSKEYKQEQFKERLAATKQNDQNLESDSGHEREKK
jgi:hypothetical protein